MSHEWIGQYGVSIHRHKGLFKALDPVVYFTRDDGTLSFQKATAAEIPDGFVAGTNPEPEHPGLVEVVAYPAGTHDSAKIPGITGLKKLPHRNHALYYRPSLQGFHGQAGSDGLLCGQISSTQYDYPLATNHLDLNKLTVITPETPPLSVLQMPREGIHPGDHVYIANEEDSGQTVKVTDLYPPKAGVREIKVAPGTTLFLKRNDANNGWLQDTSVTSIVTCSINFSAEWIRDRWPFTATWTKGRLLCAAMGNVRSNRATTARWGIPPTGSSATVPSNDRVYLELPDPPETGFALLVEINTKADGSGSVVGRALVSEGATVTVPATAKSASTKFLTVAATRRDGMLAYHLTFHAADTSDWGSDAYVLAYELVGKVTA